MKQNTKTMAGIIAAMIGIVIAGALLLFLFRDITMAPTFLVANGTLKVTDTYSVQIPLDGATLQLQTGAAAFAARVAGTSMGNIRKGWYRMDGVEGNVYASLMDDTQDSILLVSGGKRYYLNCRTPQETESLFRELEDDVG